MALIECPECGRGVSNMAEKCPDCGYPLAANRTDGEVAIKIMNGLAGKVRIFDVDCGNSVIWEGRAGQIARFNIDKDTRIGIGWGLGAKRPSAGTTILAKARRKYELKMTQGFFNSRIELVEVDIIDAGN